MKHNEFKAFFKKKLIEEFKQFEIISIDEYTSNRNLYLLDKDTLEVKLFLTTFWGTNNFHIKAFRITEKIRTKKEEIHQYKDASIDIEGNYFETHKIKHLFKEMHKTMKGLK